MGRADVVNRVWSEPASAGEYTPTDSIPASAAALAMRMAISPRLAINTRLSDPTASEPVVAARPVSSLRSAGGALRVAHYDGVVADAPERVGGKGPAAAEHQFGHRSRVGIEFHVEQLAEGVAL